ncbi:hypothetical protein SASPL_129768 [Salvia splendens]|uniref:Ubiquitin-like protease family profile domain-containing protein n=1 Tax=Salvia splendens TaxID=180675 RepID=A0A8X8XFL6_SALSN|nr:hypothetical protein SASPL_129768 [Salvia splendens]
MNEAQINSVKEIGFESVLHYGIEYIPSRLAFSLLKSFDEEKCKIKLYNEKKIHITVEDVELVYGFPRGNITYCREKWKSNAHFMRELAEQCDTKPGNVNHKAVEQLMLADKEGGPQFKRLFLEEQQQGNEEKSVDVNESGVGSSSQNILPSHMVANVVKYIKQINDGRTNLLRVLKEASSQIENNDLFGLICDIARSAIGSQKSPVASVSDIFLHLSQSYNIGNDVAVDNWKALFDSIRNAEKANETIEDLNEFSTFRLDDFFDKVNNLPTSPVGDPEEEDREDAATCSIVEYMMQEGIETMDDTPPEWNVQKQGYKGKETIHEEKEKTPENAERRMTVYQGRNVTSTAVSNNIPISHSVNNKNLDRCCQILFSNIFFHAIQFFFPVFTSGYYYLVVFWMKINKIEIIDSVKPPKAKDPLEKYSLHVGILKGKGMEYWLFSTWHKDSTDTLRKILRSDAYIKEQQEVYGYAMEIDEGSESQNAENVSQRLLVKRKPLFFVDAISQLNEAQINSVKEMAFESVLHYRIDYIPSRLAFSLLKSFDEEKCMIKLCNGKKIHITEEDVELVYGFPRGDIAYCREKWKSNVPFMRELAEQCDTKPANVNHKAVEQLMLADQEGGPQFKRLFLVLLESTLIEPSTCGMIKSKIGEIVDDLDNVRNINWCSYTISVLKFAMKNWSKTEKNAFAGPLPFLMIELYKTSVLFSVGSQTTTIEVVNEKCQLLSKMFEEDKPETFDRWKTISESILLAQKEKEALEDLAEFPTFKTPRFLDKVFFPVCANFHYYLVVYWMKKNTIEIIDNNKPHKAMDPFENYLYILQKDMFEAYFIEKKMLDISENVNKSSINFLHLEWATSTNNKDCGVYLMRHMETYVGKKGNEWDIGFSGRSVKIPQILRGRYCYTMISSIYNNQRSPMLQLAHDWMEVNMEKLHELNNKYKELFSRRKK